MKKHASTIFTLWKQYGMNTWFCFLKVKLILTRERFGNYCMEIPKAISPICNCNKEGKEKAEFVIWFERYSKSLKESINF